MTFCNANQVKAVLFDMDGVILESMAAHVASWRAAFAEIDVFLEDEFFYLNEGNLEWELLRTRLDGCGPAVTAEIFDALIARQREIYNLDHRPSVRLYSGAVRLIEWLSGSGVRLGLVTSSPRRVMPESLLAWLEFHFDTVVTGDQVSRGKPHPEPYLTALSRLRVTPADVVVVENAPAGIQAAKAANLACLALSTTLPPFRLSAADLVLPDHAALREWFRQRIDANP